MTNDAFGVLVVSGFFGTTGVLLAFFPRAIPRALNAYSELIGMKTRVDVRDNEKLGVRISGGIFIVIAIFVLIKWGSILWK
ncbi:MAG: hypothetical protein HZB23_07600 [Deltaproteobacteria bacterium]|nr:hypothetical protein [Deltaproteobacteria bacterium]